FNRKYARTGTLWNARYRSSVIETETYWLTCLRYIERNPVRSAIVDSPADYQWSSYRAHALGEWPAWLTPHRTYLALGRTRLARQAPYRPICGAPDPDDALLLRQLGTSP